MDWLFDGINKIIKEPSGSGNTSFDVKADLYSAWKRWALDNPSFLPAFIVEGGTPIGNTGLFTGTSFILTNGWKLMAADHDHQVTLNGNLFSDDGVVSVNNPVSNSTLVINSSVSAQGISTASVDNAILTLVNQRVMELWSIHGLDILNPLVVTQTARTAGSISQTIETTGSTVTQQTTVSRDP
jgi:hypothetical protein